MPRELAQKKLENIDTQIGPSSSIPESAGQRCGTGTTFW